MRRVLVSSFLADVTQQIHSFRARGVMLIQSSLASASEAIAWRKSAGIWCTVPEAIGCRGMVAAFYSRPPGVR
jgi:hypothetical protein